MERERKLKKARREVHGKGEGKRELNLLSSVKLLK